MFSTFAQSTKLQKQRKKGKAFSQASRSERGLYVGSIDSSPSVDWISSIDHSLPVEAVDGAGYYSKIAFHSLSEFYKGKS